MGKYMTINGSDGYIAEWKRHHPLHYFIFEKWGGPVREAWEKVNCLERTEGEIPLSLEMLNEIREFICSLRNLGEVTTGEWIRYWEGWEWSPQEGMAIDLEKIDRAIGYCMGTGEPVQYVFSY